MDNCLTPFCNRVLIAVMLKIGKAGEYGLSLLGGYHIVTTCLSKTIILPFRVTVNFISAFSNRRQTILHTVLCGGVFGFRFGVLGEGILNIVIVGN